LKNSATASFLFGALVIKVLKSKKLNLVGGRLSNGFFDFYSASSSTSFFFGFGSSFFFGASFFFSSFFGAYVPVATENTGNI
jgi:hypothetical protein